MKALVIASLLAASLGTARLPSISSVLRFARAADTTSTTALCANSDISGEHTIGKGTTTITGCTVNDDLELNFPFAVNGRAALTVKGGRVESYTEVNVNTYSPVAITFDGVEFVNTYIYLYGSLNTGSSVTVTGCKFTYNDQGGGWYTPLYTEFNYVAFSKIVFSNNVVTNDQEEEKGMGTGGLYFDSYTAFANSEVTFEGNKFVRTNATAESYFYSLVFDEVRASDLTVNFNNNEMDIGSYYGTGLDFERSTSCYDCTEGKVTINAAGNTFTNAVYYFNVEDDGGNADVTFRDNTVQCMDANDGDGNSIASIYNNNNPYDRTQPFIVNMRDNTFENCQAVPYIATPFLVDGSAVAVSGNLFIQNDVAVPAMVIVAGAANVFSPQSIVSIAGNELRSEIAPENYTAKMFYLQTPVPSDESDREQYGSIGVCNNKYLGTVHPLTELTDYVEVAHENATSLFVDKCVALPFTPNAAPSARAALSVAAATLAAIAAAFVTSVM